VDVLLDHRHVQDLLIVVEGLLAEDRNPGPVVEPNPLKNPRTTTRRRITAAKWVRYRNIAKYTIRGYSFIDIFANFETVVSPLILHMAVAEPEHHESVMTIFPPFGSRPNC
jgi:hypothetical protein